MKITYRVVCRVGRAGFEMTSAVVSPSPAEAVALVQRFGVLHNISFADDPSSWSVTPLLCLDETFVSMLEDSFKPIRDERPEVSE